MRLIAPEARPRFPRPSDGSPRPPVLFHAARPLGHTANSAGGGTGGRDTVLASPGARADTTPHRHAARRWDSPAMGRWSRRGRDRRSRTPRAPGAGSPAPACAGPRPTPPPGAIPAQRRPTPKHRYTSRPIAAPSADSGPWYGQSSTTHPVDPRSPSAPANGTKPPSDLAGRPGSTTHNPYPCRSGRSVPYPGWNFPPPRRAPSAQKGPDRLRDQNRRFHRSRTLSSRTNDTTPAFFRDGNHF